MVGLLSFLVTAPVLALAQVGASDPIVIRDVSIIDVEAGLVVPHQSVRIEGNRIARIVSAGSDDDVAAKVIAGTGLYLMPGLFDAHVHLVASRETFPPLLVANGVTCVRDLGGPTEEILQLRADAAEAKIVCPRIICTGAIVDGNPPIWPTFSEVCETPEQARAAVRKLHDAGVDQIKVYSRLTPECYEAAVAEAHALGLKATGHIPMQVTFQEALRAGQDCAEHLLGFERVLSQLAGGEQDDQQRQPIWERFAGWSKLETIDKAALDEFLAEIKAAGMVQCPTLVVMVGIGQISQEKAAPDPRMVYVPESLKSFWSSGPYGSFSKWAADSVKPKQRMIAALHRSGVTLVVGTDLANPNVFAGFAVHEEMKLWQDAGIPAIDVLRAATTRSAALCDLQGDYGQIKSGMAASLVLVRANPLDDIANASKIEAVFLEGKYLDRAALDGMLADVKRYAAGTRPQNNAVDWTLPGEVVARGRYQLRFQQWNAGVEDFMITEDDEGFWIRAHNQPMGGPQSPAVTTLRLGKDHAVQSAQWKQLTAAKVVAEYAREGEKVRIKVRSGDKPPTMQERDVPKQAIISAAIFAGEFASLGATELKVGESREVPVASFGHQGWDLLTAPCTITRLEDAQLALSPQEIYDARHYTTVLKIPMGDFEGELWTDERGVLLKSVTKMPFGTMQAQLEPKRPNPPGPAAPRQPAD
jgi:imidazolonepropionase-like amidohydrolase